MSPCISSNNGISPNTMFGFLYNFNNKNGKKKKNENQNLIITPEAEVTVAGTGSPQEPTLSTKAGRVEEAFCS